MMRRTLLLALARGLLWFFTFLAVVFVVIALGIGDASHLSVTGLLLWAAVFGGVGFSSELFTLLKEEGDG